MSFFFFFYGSFAVCSVTTMNPSAYLESMLKSWRVFFTWLHEVFDPNRPLLCPTAEPLPLMELCRRAARQALGRHRIHHIQSLPLPQTLKNYLQYQWDTHSQKTHLWSLDTCSEMICAAGDLRTVEALCCAQMLVECRKDNLSSQTTSISFLYMTMRWL